MISSSPQRTSASLPLVDTVQLIFFPALLCLYYYSDLSRLKWLSNFPCSPLCRISRGLSSDTLVESQRFPSSLIFSRFPNQQNNLLFQLHWNSSSNLPSRVPASTWLQAINCRHMPARLLCRLFLLDIYAWVCWTGFEIVFTQEFVELLVPG